MQAEDFDKIISKHYHGELGGELRQLAVLFSKPVWADMEAGLRAHFGARPGFTLEIGLGYIDKIPVAEFIGKVTGLNGGPIDERVEIGDAALFVIDQRSNSRTNYHQTDARAIILQAKHAPNCNVPGVPIVTPSSDINDSTVKELALLSAWPKFDLYPTGSSKSKLLDNCDVPKSCGDKGRQSSSCGWYIACAPKVTCGWPAHWLAAPANMGAVAKNTLGEVFYELILGRRSKNGMGTCFDYDEVVLRDLINTPTKLSGNTPTGWDDLCHVLLAQCGTRFLPKSLFSKGIRGVGIRLNALFPLDLMLSGISGALKRLWQLATGNSKKMHIVVVSIRHQE